MVTTQYVFSQSIVNHYDVDRWFGTGCILSHKGDYITLRGMPEYRTGTYGSIISITYIYETGNIDNLPKDKVLELKPTDIHTVRNREGTDDRPRYNVRVEALGPLYLEGQYRGYIEPEIPIEPEPIPEPIPDEIPVEPSLEVKYGPLITFLLRFPLFQKRFYG